MATMSRPTHAFLLFFHSTSTFLFTLLFAASRFYSFLLMRFIPIRLVFLVEPFYGLACMLMPTTL
jgi:hypothetical protein